jgi:hypothetical protein
MRRSRDRQPRRRRPAGQGDGGWEPAPGSIVSDPSYRLMLAKDDRIKVRIASDADDQTVEFAIVLQHRDERDENHWQTVSEIDSKHGTVHTHRYSRRSGRRVGEPQCLKKLATVTDVQEGYSQALSSLLDQDAWQSDVQRRRTC